MRNVSLYSSSGRAPESGSASGTGATEPSLAAESARAGPGSGPGTGEVPRSALGRFYVRHERRVLVGSGALAVLLALLLYGAVSSPVVPLTQRDIDQAVLHALSSQPPLPSLESMAAEVIRPSVVWVRQLGADLHEAPLQSIGTGVVIVEDGTILTNMHVVAGAERLGVVFSDGTESQADVVSVQPEQDLAVIRARSLPDDLIPATLASTRDLRTGDRVVAMGFPFGIGPSASAGVISGLRREYVTPEGGRALSNLIQFDAAVNPGNSGGPLVNTDGHVVGIVTALLNPSQRVFIGIGFAVPIETATAGVGMSPF
jgi:S1-C subfamily serine protease